MTALITLPQAFVDILVWELAWLVYIPLAWFLGRKSAHLSKWSRLEAGADDKNGVASAISSHSSDLDKPTACI